MNNQIALGKLGFYWRMTEKPNVPPNPVPDLVDFSFAFLEEYQLIIQTREPQIWSYLETVYKENYNVGYLQEGHDLAQSYGGDFLNYIDFAVENYNKEVKRISEVGAGGCYILKKLKEKGYGVAAVDPSPIAEQKGKDFGIEVIPAFYPAPHSIPKSDMIIHYDVLEHVAEPAKFLASHVADLNPAGLVLFAVPDCTHYIASGDISMVLHEHLNYFDSESLQNVVEAAGLEVLDIRKADYGGVLYCVARVPKAPKEWVAKKGTDKFKAFSERCNTLKTRVDAFIDEATAPGNSLGCYIPLRAIPYLSTSVTNKSALRFFDDNKGIYGQYFDAFPVPVENGEDLLKKPVTHLLIMSAAFGEKIKNRVQAETSPEKIKIMTLSDFYSS